MQTTRPEATPTTGGRSPSSPPLPALPEPARAGDLRCCLCHDLLAGGESQTCEGCGTLTHPECAREVGGQACPTLGCSGAASPAGGRWPAGLAPIAWALGLTVAGDGLLYDAPGCGVTAFAFAAAAAVAWQRRARILRGGPWVLLWVALALGASLQASLIGRALLVILGWTALATSRAPAGRPPLLDGLLQGLAEGGRSLVAWPLDLLHAARSPARSTRPPVWVFAGPLGLVAAFALLVVPANQVLAGWVGSCLRAIASGVAEFSFGRALFCTAIGLGAYGLFRFRRTRSRLFTEAPLPAPPDAASSRNALLACLLSFAGLNALFLAANAADVLCLWLTAALPEGVTYSEFAHQGSYRLIAAVLLASVTVTALLPTGPRLDHPWARRLACAFVGQNLLVLAGAAKRLFLYVDVYGLTRFRVAVVLWLILVAVGLVLVALRMVWRRRVLFLVRTNAASTVLLLAAAACLNLDGAVAAWNVERYARSMAEGVPLRADVDVAYLEDLGSSALPEIARLAAVARRYGDLETSQAAAAATARGLAAERRRLRRWAAWTWRRATSAQQASETLRAAGLDPNAPTSRPARDAAASSAR